jgi:hypothetical protein
MAASLLARAGAAGTAAALVIACALAGCSGGHAADSWAGRGAPVGNPGADPAPSRPSDDFVTGVSGLRVALETRVVASGGLIRPVTSACDATAIEPQFTCRVTYLGQVVTYRVTTAPDTAGGYTWKATPDKLIATKAGVEAAMWRKYAARASAISCDTPFPAAQRVTPTTALPQRCYFKPTQGDEAFGSSSANGDRTVAVQVKIFDGLISLDEATQ